MNKFFMVRPNRPTFLSKYHITSKLIQLNRFKRGTVHKWYGTVQFRRTNFLGASKFLVINLLYKEREREVQILNHYTFSIDCPFSIFDKSILNNTTTYASSIHTFISKTPITPPKAFRVGWALRSCRQCGLDCTHFSIKVCLFQRKCRLCRRRKKVHIHGDRKNLRMEMIKNVNKRTIKVEK